MITWLLKVELEILNVTDTTDSIIFLVLLKSRTRNIIESVVSVK